MVIRRSFWGAFFMLLPPWQGHALFLKLWTMPEGPEVKTVARTLRSELLGHQLGSLWHSPLRLRRTVDYQAFHRLENMTVDDVSCYGKILFIHLEKRPALFAQLGMTGQLTLSKSAAPLLPHTHLRWQLKKTDQELRYIDPRRFGLVDICDEKIRADMINKLGPDPFSMSAGDKIRAMTAMKTSKRPIKEILLDQSMIAGVGNIYASEALFKAGIDPKRRGVDLSKAEYERLMPQIVAVMEMAFANCGTTFSNYVDGAGKKGSNLPFLEVFMRHGQPCKRCLRPIERIKQGGRSTFWCRDCQQ